MIRREMPIKLYTCGKLLKFSIQCFLNQVFISTWDGRRLRQSLSGKRRKMPGKYLFKNISFFSRAFLVTKKCRKRITLYMDGKLFKFPFQRYTKLKLRTRVERRKECCKWAEITLYKIKINIIISKCINISQLYFHNWKIHYAVPRGSLISVYISLERKFKGLFSYV